MDDLFAAGVLVAAVLASYFFCLRPMRRGHCAVRRQLGDRDEKVRRLRDDVERLKREMSTGRQPSGRLDEAR